MGLDLVVWGCSKKSYDIIAKEDREDLDFSGHLSKKGAAALERGFFNEETGEYENEIFSGRVGTYSTLHRDYRIPLINAVHGTKFTYADIDEAYRVQGANIIEECLANEGKPSDKLNALHKIVEHADHTGYYLHEDCKFIVTHLGEEMDKVQREYREKQTAEYPDFKDDWELTFFKALKLCAETENSVIGFY